MYKGYFKLTHAGIAVYSVKNDVFTIKAEDEKKPREWILLIRLEAGE